jgi:hypothetical protein
MSIKANELRIGNLFITPLHDNPGSVVGIDSTSDSVELQDEGGFEETTFASLIPIPLTEEWLLKFGFWKRDESNVWRCSRIIDSNYCIHQTGMKYPFDIRIDHSNHQYITTPKFVHQLQNLYFALTGEELIIKQL